MKKFSFKKLATVSLFFTSIIFTSAFTTCFIPTISTSHSNDQPNATKIDLNDYNNKTLPEFYKPEPLDNIKEILIGQLENIESTRPVGWEDWKCYPNQFEDFVPTLIDTGGSFTLTAKTNAVNYVGSSTATISFNYTNYSKTDISTIITQPMLNTTIDYDLWNNSTLSKQYILSQFKQMYPILDTNELDITADYSSDAVLKSGIGTATISAKSGSLIYTPSSIDVQFHFKPRLDLILVNVNKIQIAHQWYSGFTTHIDEIKFSIYSANLSRINVFDSFSDSITVLLEDNGDENNSYLEVSPIVNGIFYFRTGQNLDVNCYPKLTSDYKPIPISWIDYDEDSRTINGLKSDVQFTDQYDTLDLSSFSECTTIANSAFICEGSTAKYVLNKQFFGSTAIYVSGSKNYFDGNGNLSIVHNQSLDGPIKYLFLPDSLITIGERAFRLAYSFDSLLIFPKNLTFLPGYCLNFIGFTSIWINENYASQPINTYSVIFSPFLLCMGMDHNNSAFTFYYHYDKSNVANGWMIYPSKYALTQIGTSGYYLSDGDSNNNKMGFGQKPVLALGVIDMRNMLDYTKKWDGTERIGVDTSSYTFYDSFTSDGFFVHNNATEVILPSEYTTWTSVSMRAPSLLTAFWVTDTQNVLQPTNFELANRDKYNGSEFAWCNFVLHVPNALLNNYLSIWENMISGTQSLSIIGDADLII